MSKKYTVVTMTRDNPLPVFGISIFGRAEFDAINNNGPVEVLAWLDSDKVYNIEVLESLIFSAKQALKTRNKG